MGTEEHTYVAQLAKLLMVDGYESQLAQALTLHPVVHDIAQAVERSTLLQLLLGLAYGGGHPEAETRMFVNLNANHLCIFMVDKWS